jgi:hypothetical protein
MPSAPIPAAAVSPDQPVPAEFDLLCESCAYSLVGLMTDRCPECGTVFDPAQLPLARVPWLYRKRLGKSSTHLRTTWMVLASPRVFALELCRPVRISESDAHAFRLRTIRMAAVAPIVPVLLAIQQQMPAGAPWWVWPSIGLACVPWWFAIYVLLRLATDLPTFIWSGIPGRTYDLSPLHHYACAPLLLLPIPALLATVAMYFFQADLFGMRGVITPLGWFVLAALLLPTLLLTWILPLVLMHTATGCKLRRVFALAAYLPVHWLMMTMLVGMSALAILIGIGIVMEILGKLF